MKKKIVSLVILTFLLTSISFNPVSSKIVNSELLELEYTCETKNIETKNEDIQITNFQKGYLYMLSMSPVKLPILDLFNNGCAVVINKNLKLETNAEIQAPIFIKTGDTIRINTETGNYVERVKE